MENTKWRSEIDALLIEAGKYLVSADQSVEPQRVLQSLVTKLKQISTQLFCTNQVAKLENIVATSERATTKILVEQPYFYHQLLNKVLFIYVELLDKLQGKER